MPWQNLQGFVIFLITRARNKMPTCQRCKDPNKKSSDFHWAEKNVSRKKICAKCLNTEATERRKTLPKSAYHNTITKMNIEHSIEAKLFNPMITRPW